MTYSVADVTLLQLIGRLPAPILFPARLRAHPARAGTEKKK
jgi:hypothetical protein